MGDLEQVPALAVVHDGGEDIGIVVVLEVTGEQKALVAQADREHDRCPVDGTPVAEHAVGDGLPRWPQYVDADAAQRQAVPLEQAHAADAVPRCRRPQLTHAGTLAVHVRLGDAADGVARHQPGQAAGVVLVRMCQDHQVDTSIPHGDALVEPAHQQVRIGATIDEHAAAVGDLQQDGVALADVEHAHA